MPTYVVYVDQVFVGSLVMNLMILWVTAKLGGVSYSRVRLLGGAALGALYSLALFFPPVSYLLTPGGKFLVSVIMVAAVFLPRPPLKALVLLGYFYLVTFALGGTVQGIINFLHGNYSGGPVAAAMQAVDAYLWYGILLALALYWSLGRIAPAQMRKRLMLPLLQVQLVVGFRGRRTRLAAMLDTGNSLTDPVTGDPVIIVEYQSLQHLLPEKVRLVVEKHGPDRAADILGDLGPDIATGHFRLIPYRSVGRESGWLVGFRPDAVELIQNGRVQKGGPAVVALCGDRLRGDVPCSALVPPTLLDNRLAG